MNPSKGLAGKRMISNVVPNKLVGAALMLLWAMLFSTAMAFAKTLPQDMPSMVVVFMRCIFGLMFFMPIAAYRGNLSLKTNKLTLHLLRVCFIGLAMFCTYFAYRNLPLAMATSIGMTGPLFTTCLAMLILKDKVSWRKWIVILLGYCGVIVIARPDMEPISIGVWVEILANIAAASSIICTKILTRTEKSETILLYANLFMVVISSVFAYFVWETPKYDDVMALVCIGALGVASQYCSVTAMRYANPSFLAPFEYMRLCFAIPVGLAFFGEIPTLSMLAGSGVIILATSLLTRIEIKESQQAKLAS